MAAPAPFSMRTSMSRATSIAAPSGVRGKRRAGPSAAGMPTVRARLPVATAKSCSRGMRSDDVSVIGYLGSVKIRSRQCRDIALRCLACPNGRPGRINVPKARPYMDFRSNGPAGLTCRRHVPTSQGPFLPDEPVDEGAGGCFDLGGGVEAGGVEGVGATGVEGLADGEGVGDVGA